MPQQKGFKRAAKVLQRKQRKERARKKDAIAKVGMKPPTAATNTGKEQAHDHEHGHDHDHADHKH